MKKFFVILLMMLTTMTMGAQRHHDHGRGHDRHRVECATHEQMSMALQVINQQSFDDKKLEIAKLCVVLGHFCVDDLARLAKPFSFDDRRLDFLIFAYDYCEDPQNYYALRDVFTFRSNFDTMMDTLHPRYRH